MSGGEVQWGNAAIDQPGKLKSHITFKRILHFCCREGHREVYVSLSPGTSFNQYNLEISLQLLDLGPEVEGRKKEASY